MSVLDQFTRWQAMTWDYSGRLQTAQMDIAELAEAASRACARVLSPTCREALQGKDWVPAQARGPS